MNKIAVRESENKGGKAEDSPAAQRQTTVQPDMSGFLRLQCLPHVVAAPRGDISLSLQGKKNPGSTTSPNPHHCEWLCGNPLV